MTKSLNWQNWHIDYNISHTFFIGPLVLNVFMISLDESIAKIMTAQFGMFHCIIITNKTTEICNVLTNLELFF